MSISSIPFRKNLFQTAKPWRILPPIPRRHPQLLQKLENEDEDDNEPNKRPNPSLEPLTNSIIAHSKLGGLSEAFADFSLIRRQSSPLLLLPISALLSSAAAHRSLLAGEQLHALIFSLGLHSLSHRLTSFYLALGLLSDARSIAQSSADALQWNRVISAYLKDGFHSKALAFYDKMIESGVEPDCFTYPSLLKACGETHDLELGKEIHRRVSSNGFAGNLFVCNALISMYAKCGTLDVASELFDGMPERDVVSWNSMIAGYASKGMWREAFGLFERMRVVGLEGNSMTWNTIVGGKLQIGEYEAALGMISQMRSRGLEVDFVTLIIGLNACSRIGSLRLGKEIHGLVIRFAYDWIESVRNALITLYSRCKDMGRAYFLFQTAGIRSMVTWNTTIAGFTLADKAEEASFVFRDMVWSGFQPNYVTVVTILSLCARVANLQHGRELHCYITKQGFECYRLLWNCLVDMYSKSGRILVARRVFDAISDRDEVSYTSLIAGYGMQGEGITALRFFDEMIGRGIKPDSITMVAVLSACSHSGLVTQGQLIFDKMADSYGIKPQMEHFSCMVDLFGRAGLLKKAEDILNRTPFRPTAAMWAAVVGACIVHRGTEIGKRAAARLLEMKTNNAGHYVLIANMYAAARCWEELSNVRRLMRDLGVRKAPGVAWADLGNGFHPFSVADRSSVMSAKIYVLLDGLSAQMIDAGYAGNEDLEFDEGES